MFFLFFFLADSLSAQSSYSISSLGVPTTSLTPDKDITAENEQKKRGGNITLLCLQATCSVSFHPQVPMQKKKKCTATGAVKCSPQALSEKRGNPLSIMLLSSSHTYSIKCLVILLLYMCKSFTFCQRRGFHNKNLTPLTGSRRNRIPPGTKRSFTRARPATDSDKDDNGCSDVVRTAFKSCCAGGNNTTSQNTAQPPPLPTAATVEPNSRKVHSAAPRSAYPFLFSVAYHRRGNDSRWKRWLSLHKV